MALQLSIITEEGIVLNNAYFRVMSYSGDMNQVNVLLVAHANQQARIDDKKEVERRFLTLSTPSGDIGSDMVAWCYNQIKLLPDYSSAIDV